jgi:deoxyribonuclease I
MKRSIAIGVLVILAVALAAAQSPRGNTQIANFNAAKKQLAEHVYMDHRITLYCGCQYDAHGAVQLGTCDYKIKHNQSRGKRIEWEHAVPAARFGHSFKAWRQGDPRCVVGSGKNKGKHYSGRKCAEKASPDFNHMEGDMYNLFPAVGELNADHSNKPLGIIPGEAREYGACDIEISKTTLEPGDSIRGDMARATLYMDWAYPGRIKLTDEERAMFEQWDAADPVDAWECERAKRIQSAQGNDNPLVSKHCQL